MTWRRFDWRLLLLLLATLLVVGTFFMPRVTVQQPVHRYLFIVDITRSMTAADYQKGGGAISRLEFIKMALPEVIRELPCGSEVGLGVFTDRRGYLLFMPIKVCHNYRLIRTAIEHINWRMAWAGGSRIAKGVYNLIQMVQRLQAKRGKPMQLVFMTDGHEAPPLNPRYAPNFDKITGSGDDGIVPGALTLAARGQRAASEPPRFRGEPGAINGLIVGVGGHALTPIPKYNDEGEQVGFLGPDDVQQATRFGVPPTDMSDRAGYQPRNAPWGAAAPTGNEHLTYVHEEHLRELAKKTGLGYHHLVDAAGLSDALQTRAVARTIKAEADVRFIPASVALALLVCLYALAPVVARRRRVPGRAPRPTDRRPRRWALFTRSQPSTQ